MAQLPIYLYGSDVLRAKAKPVRAIDDSVVRLIYDMFETMRKANGIGLAATQVGDLRRIITIDIGDAEDNEEGEEEQPEHPTSPGLPRTVVMINPEVLSADGSWKVKEGCLSLPGLHAEVERAEKIRVRFFDADFKETILDADGLLARVMLHEMDHLDGVLFTDRISKAQKSVVLPKLRKIRKGDVDADYPVVAAVDA